jgi:hypothetical protein
LAVTEDFVFGFLRSYFINAFSNKISDNFLEELIAYFPFRGCSVGIIDERDL